MAKIIINGRFLIHRITGVERFAREIVRELDRIVKPGEYEIACPPETEKILELKNIKVVKIGRLHNQLWEHISFPLYVKKRKAVSLNLCNVGPLLDPGIVCIHDMKVRAKPEYFSKKFMLWYRILFFNAARRAKKLLTVSDFSKNEIIKYYNVESDKISVVPNGWQHLERISCDENVLRKEALQKGTYFFSMCSLEPNKNFRWIAETAKKNVSETFVVAGSVNNKIFSNGLGFECPSNMRLIGYVSDEEAKTLMQNCKAFLFPSFYEGFGIPPLEAMSTGRPVVVSDIPVMHEIFGTTARYINPMDVGVNLNETMMKKVDDCFCVLEKYSWEKSARMMARINRNTIL